MNVVLVMGMLVVLGLVGSLLIRRIKFPAVTGYLIVGILLGPSVSGILSVEMTRQFSHVVTPLALGIIAYLIGGSLPLSTLRGLRRNIALIVVCEGTFAWLFVLVAVAFVAPLVLPPSILSFESYLAMGIIIGAISMATAPAVTMAIVSEVRAKGPLTTTLLGVVALDDALAVMAYAISIGAVTVLLGTADTLSPAMLFLSQLGLIGASVALGIGAAFLMLWFARFARNRQELLAMLLGSVVLSTGLAEQLNLFAIIANMALGFVVVNRQKASFDLISVVWDIEGVVFVLFFTIAGAHLDLGIIRSAGLLAGLIVLGRCGGKFLGAWTGATLSGAPPMVRKYLGLALLPKAGVTLGLALLVVETPGLESISPLLISGVLASTLINELLAPPISKLALVRAGEAGQREETLA